MVRTKRVVDGCHTVAPGIANAFLLETREGLVLVDAGFPGREGDILEAIRRLGHGPRALKHIVLTHAHPDHVGSAAALVRATREQTWMHREDAPVAENRSSMRPLRPSPGVLPRLLFAAMARMGPPIWDAVAIDHPVADGDVLPFDDLRVVHVPGHSAGQIALLWPDRNLLVAADSCMHLLSLRAPLVNEDSALGRRSLARLAHHRSTRWCSATDAPLCPARTSASDRLSRRGGRRHKRCRDDGVGRSTASDPLAARENRR